MDKGGLAVSCCRCIFNSRDSTVSSKLISPDLESCLNLAVSGRAPMKNVHGAHISSGEPEDRRGPNANSGETGCSAAPGDAEEEAARLAVLERGERRRRSLELKMAKEKAQKYLESLTLKKKEKDDEVHSKQYIVA